MKIEAPIYVTRPSLPPLNEYVKLLEEIWKTRNLTNNGKFHQELEAKLCEFLGVKYISLFSNGTLALVTALQALKITGEVITTPFSFVATTHSLWWNGIKPVFVDIDPETYNLDTDKIEAAITPFTTAIMPVHVYGTPCNVVKMKEIADKYGLKIIYDACHAFGVKYKNESILNFGDLSILSFHATKIFNTFEGGAIVCNNEETKKRIDFLKNFGFADEVTVVAPGINAKMNEAQAALGVLQLKRINESIDKRKIIVNEYRSRLRKISGVKFLQDFDYVETNYQYFPIFINEIVYGKNRDAIYEELKKVNIFTRRYFYPLISDFSTYKALPSSSHENLPVAIKAANEVLCLPIYPDLDLETVVFICDFISNLKS
ncbi:MAG: DegT/DnrJ/EryC1/StrS family aminotransferase [Bacteroidota bacterium]